MPNGEQRPSTQLLGFMAPSSRILINYLIVVLKKGKGKEGKEGTWRLIPSFGVGESNYLIC